MSDLTRVDEWILTKLRDDPQVGGVIGQRVYSDAAPQGAAMPMVLFAFLGGSDKTQTFLRRFTNAIYLVRAVAQSSSYAAVEPISDRIDEILNVPTQGAFVRGVLITNVLREQPHQRKDLENGVPYVYLGGFYRIRYQPQEV